MAKTFLSFIIPTYNSQRYIGKVLKSILKQKYPLKKIELIIVDDNSSDFTIKEVNKYKKFFPFFKVIVKNRKIFKGAAISTNIGIEISKGDFICLVDSDAVLANNWINEILLKFTDKRVGMAAGLIKTANSNNLWAAFAGRELEDRYEALKDDEVDHLSTCNTIYRRELFKKIGLFNKDLYYGYDVDFSYRVRKMGYKILLVKRTFCLHFWKENLKDYVNQVFNTGYARLQMITKYQDKKIGGKISGLKLMAQVPMTLVFVILFLASLLNRNFTYPFLFSVILLFLIQLPQTLRIIIKYHDFRFLVFPVILVSRNIIWLWAYLLYNIRR